MLWHLVLLAALNMPPGWKWPPSPQMKADGAACLAHLDELGVIWSRAPATPRIATPVYLPTMEIGGVALTPIWKEGPFPMDCFLAAAFAERGAPALRAAGVKEVRFAEIHDYRTLRRHRGVLSRHALGLAIDVFEFVDEAGAKHVVKKDYPDELLTAVERAINDTGAFRTLLTPRTDRRDHRDHFHFEARTAPEREPPVIRGPMTSLATPLAGSAGL
jgi:hypothetical protein